MAKHFNNVIMDLLILEQGFAWQHQLKYHLVVIHNLHVIFMNINISFFCIWTVCENWIEDNLRPSQLADAKRKPKKIQAATEFEPTTSVRLMPVMCSTDWTSTPNWTSRRLQD